MDIGILKTEITNDPLARGYAGMTNAAVVIDINTAYRSVNKSSMTGTEILNAIDKGEFNALSADNQQRVWDILHLGDVNPFGLEEDLFVDVFGGGSTTISTLQGLRVQSVSRGEELGVGRVREGHVLEARL